MIKEIIVALLIFHGVIHLLGFAKSANIKEMDQFNENISKPYGFLWFLACILFMLAGIALLLGQFWWIMTAIISLFLSQTLIVRYWFDAKTGTIVNVLLVVVILIYFNIK